MSDDPRSVSTDERLSRPLQHQRSHMPAGTEIALKREHWVVGDAETRKGLAIVFESEDYARLFAAAPDLLALARQYASECAECGGSGEIVVNETAERNPIDDKARPCADCSDIRAVIAKAEGKL